MSRNEKILKSFVYDGLGFPVILENVLFHKIRGEWLPKIDVRMLSEIVFKMLSLKPSRLTGNEIKFIRTYLGKSSKEKTNVISYQQNENEYLFVFFDSEIQEIKGIQFWIIDPFFLDADAIKKILVSNDWQTSNLPEKNPHVVNLAVANYSLKLGASFLTYQFNKYKSVSVIYWGADYNNLEF